MIHLVMAILFFSFGLLNILGLLDKNNPYRWVSFVGLAVCWGASAFYFGMWMVVVK